MSASRNTTNDAPPSGGTASTSAVEISDCTVLSKFGFLTNGTSPCCQSPEITCENGRVVAINSSARFLVKDPLRMPAIFGPDYLFDIPSNLPNLTELTTLNITFPPGSGEVSLGYGLYPRVTSLKKLQVLVIRNAGLKGGVPSQLGDLTDLTVLDLGDNRLEGAIPTQLERLTKLKVLDLSDNSINGNIPASLASLPLSTLRLEKNALSGEVPALPKALVDCQLVSRHWTEVTSFSCYKEPLPMPCRNNATSSMTECPRFLDTPQGSAPSSSGGVGGGSGGSFPIFKVLAIVLALAGLFQAFHAKMKAKKAQEKQEQEQAKQSPV